MLSRTANGWNFLLLKIASLLNFVPVDFDLKTCQIRHHSSGRRAVWKFYYWMGWIHNSYVLIRLIHSYMNPAYHFPAYIPNHIIFLIFNVLCSLWGYKLFIVDPDLTILLFNELYQFNNTNQGQNQNNQHQKPGKSIFDYSPQDVVLLTVWIMVYISDFYGIGKSAMARDNPQFLYSAIPAIFGVENEALFKCLWVVEQLVTYLMSTNHWLVFVFHVLSFQKLELMARNLFHDIQKMNDQNADFGSAIFGILREIRQNVLFVHLFNRLNARIIFSYKVYALGIVTFCLFTTIRLFSFGFPFSIYVIPLLYAGGHSSVYTTVYGRACRIPNNFEELKKECRLSSRKLRGQLASANSMKKVHIEVRTKKDLEEERIRQELKRQLTAIQNLGIKVGTFYTLERESTPAYIGFVFSQVVGLLVTFPV